MGMLLHNTLMEQEAAMRKQITAEKPSEVPTEEKTDAEPVKKTGGRRRINK